MFRISSGPTWRSMTAKVAGFPGMRSNASAAGGSGAAKTVSTKSGTTDEPRASMTVGAVARSASETIVEP